jgi:hypothetical protein
MSERVAVNDVSFRIVDYIISDDCSHATFGWASPYIQRRVTERVMAASEHDRLSLLQDMLSTDGGLQLAGMLWEDWCDIVMQQGSGDKGFRIRQLGVGSMGRKPQVSSTIDPPTLLRMSAQSLGLQQIAGEQRLVVPAATDTRALTKADDLPVHAAGGKIRWRARECFAAADFVELAGVCSNATSAKRHDLLLQGDTLDQGVRPILQRLHPDAVAANSAEPVPFLWLVPARRFPHFQAAPMQVSDRHAHLQQARALAPRVVQYAVEIPGPREFGKLA